MCGVDGVDLRAPRTPITPLNGGRAAGTRSIDAHPRCGWINRQTGRKTNFFSARQPAKTSMPKDMRRVYC
jgi:hypothetical protein